MAWYARVLNLLRPNRLSHDIDREIAFHVAERVDDLVARGMTEAQAMHEAQMQFGHRTQLKETTRDADVYAWLESFLSDLRYAARALRASPVFTLAAVLSLGLGIGANTSIFSLINAVMLKSLPVSHAPSLVTFASPMFGSELTNPLWEQIRDRQQVLERVAAFSAQSFDLSNGGVVRRASGAWVSGDYFNTLGVNAAQGRLLQAADDKRGCAATAVLSYAFWQNEYGGKSSAVGNTISLDNHPFTIVGVAAKNFVGAEVGASVQVFAPLCAMAAVGRGEMLDEKRGWFLNLIGQLRPEQTVTKAVQGLAQITPTLLANALTPDGAANALKEPGKYAFELKAGVGDLSTLRQTYEKALLTLMAVVAIVLCIGCANVANLLLARAASRQREISVRFALGASRWRVVRQLLTETLLLCALGAAVGLLFARWSTGLLLHLLSSNGDSLGLVVPMDGRVLAFTISVATMTGLLFGLAPAWRATRANPQDAMRAHSRSIATGRNRFSIARVLVAGQVALSLVLVVGAALLLGTFRTLATVDLGFRSENVMLAAINFSNANFSDSQLAIETERLQRELRAIPGVLHVSSSGGTPVSGGMWNGGIAIDGYTPANPRDAMVFLNEVSSEYFATLRTPIRVGREFDSRDVVNAPKVAIISEATAKKFFGGGNPVGRQFYMPSRKSQGPPYEVVGVAADAKYRSLREDPRAVVYLAKSQNAAPSSSENFEIRTSGSARDIASAVTMAASKIHPRITLKFRTLEDQVAASLSRERLMAVLSTFFGALALLLAMIGLYGTMSYSVQQRRTEIGVRLALGAARSNVFQLVLREVSVVLIVGLVLGTLAAVAASRFVASFLFGVLPTDVATMALSIGTLATVAIVAGSVPAWRAARLDPMTALRED